MKRRSNSSHLVALMLFLLVSDVASETLVEEPPFITVRLPYGISVELPRSWRVLAGDAKETLDVPGQGDIDLSGMRPPDNNPLLRASATPADRPASMSVAFFPRVGLTPQQAAELSPGALADYDRELRRKVESSFKSQEVELLGWSGTRKDHLSGHVVLVSEYRRQNRGFPSTWEQINTIPLDKGVVILTIAHSEQTGSLWRSVIMRIRASWRMNHDSSP